MKCGGPDTIRIHAHPGDCLQWKTWRFEHRAEHNVEVKKWHILVQQKQKLIRLYFKFHPVAIEKVPKLETN